VGRSAGSISSVIRRYQFAPEIMARLKKRGFLCDALLCDALFSVGHVLLCDALLFDAVLGWPSPVLDRWHVPFKIYRGH
jgi:hypothetical protein